MKTLKLNTFLLLTIVLLTTSCIEPFDIKTITFEDALVVEATISNELKYQEITLTRTFKFEESEPSAERNADVKIIDGEQNTYIFKETIPGKYVSTAEFGAVSNINYQLQINTSDGRSYSSVDTKLTNQTQINSLDVSHETNDEGEEGISLFLNSFNPSGDSRYYRFEYEETYKVVARNWSPNEIIVISGVQPYEVGLIPKTKQDKVCYNTLISKGIIQTETNSLTEDRVTAFKLRFIARDDIRLWHRYSILVKQYTQSLDAYTFYKVLNELSTSDNLFSLNQPGFINGNIISNDNIEEKVIGFFEVSSVATKRIFLSRAELFGSGVPSVGCTYFAPRLEATFGGSPLIDLIQSGQHRFYIENGPGLGIEIIGDGSYIMVKAECGDCTVSGSNVEPDFWIE